MLSEQENFERILDHDVQRGSFRSTASSDNSTVIAEEQVRKKQLKGHLTLTPKTYASVRKKHPNRKKVILKEWTGDRMEHYLTRPFRPIYIMGILLQKAGRHETRLKQLFDRRN
jgi:hypothetical protein